MENNVISFAVANPTIEQINAIYAIIKGGAGKATGTKSLAALAAGSKKGAKSTITPKKHPGKTVSPDEDEEFGEEEIDEDELEVTDEDEESEESEEEESEDDQEEEESEDEDDVEELSFSEVKSAINKYGAKNPKDMKAILAAFNIKTTKELQGLKKKWEPVYRKVMTKLNTAKKKK